jgi:hypothetical protein
MSEMTDQREEVVAPESNHTSNERTPLIPQQIEAQMCPTRPRKTKRSVALKVAKTGLINHHRGTWRTRSGEKCWRKG